MKVYTFQNINIDNRGIARIDMNGCPIDISVVTTRGERPKTDSDNYMAVRVYSQGIERVATTDMSTNTWVDETNYEFGEEKYTNYQAMLEFCGEVTAISYPTAPIDPYFKDLWIDPIITVHTPVFDFDVDLRVEDETPQVGSYVKGTAIINGILIKKEQIQPDNKLDITANTTNFFGFLSVCTTVIEEVLLDEILKYPEKFMSGIFQGKEEYIAHVFSKGAVRMGERAFKVEDFKTDMFALEGQTGLGAVIKLPYAVKEFDYSLMAIKMTDAKAVTVYLLEKGDDNTYLLRKADQYGQSTVNVFKMSEDELFEYMCDYLKNNL